MTQPNSDEQKARVQDYFGSTAESYVASFAHRTGDDLQRLIELGEWGPQLQALDVATGGGHTALAVAPHVAQVTVTDLTPRMLEKAREYLLAQGVRNAVFQVADAEQLPFAPRFDNTVEKWRDSSHGRSYTAEEWQVLFKQAGLSIEQIEFFRKTHQYDDWTERSRMPKDEKVKLARFILESNEQTRSYFEVMRNQEGQLVSFTNDFIFLKGRR